MSPWRGPLRLVRIAAVVALVSVAILAGVLVWTNARVHRSLDRSQATLSQLRVEVRQRCRDTNRTEDTLREVLTFFQHVSPADSQSFFDQAIVLIPADRTCT